MVSSKAMNYLKAKIDKDLLSSNNKRAESYGVGVKNTDILDTWKDISNYLGKDIRTCHRWEKQLGLPIHRFDKNSKRSKVFAYKSEIDQWIKERANNKEFKLKSILENRWLSTALILFIVLISTTFIFLLYTNRISTSPSSEKLSIAVFPLENHNSSEYDKYLFEGISEEIINSISRMSTLKIIPADSTFIYDDRSKNSKQISKDLGADFILKGRIEKYGDIIRIYIQLIQTRNYENIWDEVFDGKIEDLFSISEKICDKMEETLSIKTGKEESISSYHKRTQDPEAFDSYLKGSYILKKLSTNNDDPWKLYHQGNYYWGKRTADANELAINLFSQAIKIDNNFAQAYLGLSHCYVNYINYNWNFNKKWIDKAEDLAKQANTLIPDLPEYYTILIQINLIKEIAFDENTRNIAFDLAQESIKRNPNHALLNSIVGYCYFLKFGEEGKEEDFDKAIEYKEKSFWLSPFSIHNHVYVELLMLKKEFFKAIEVCNFIKKHDSSSRALFRLGEVYYYIGDLDKSQELFEKFESPWEFKMASLYYLGMIASRKGETEKANKIVQEIEITSPESFEKQLRLASIYMGLGESELGYRYLEAFFRKSSTRKKRFIYHRYIEMDSNFDEFKKEEKFKKIIQDEE